MVEDGPNFIKYSTYIDVTKLFTSYPSLYSWEYIRLMRSQLDSSGKFRIPNVTTFLGILSHARVSFSSGTLSYLLERFLNVKGALQEIQAAADEILLKMDCEMGRLLNLVEISIALRQTETVIEYAKKGLAFDSKEQLLAIVNIEAAKAKEKQDSLAIETMNLTE